MSAKIVIIAAVATATVVAAGAAFIIPRLASDTKEPKVEATQATKTVEAPPKPVQILTSAFPASVVGSNGASRASTFVLVMLTVDDKWAATVCELEPRLIDVAIGYFEAHPLIQDSRGTVLFNPRPALSQLIEGAVRGVIGPAAISDVSFQARSGVLSPKAQAKALRVVYVCEGGKATKP